MALRKMKSYVAPLIAASSSSLLAFALILALVSNRAYTNAQSTNTSTQFSVAVENGSVAIYASDFATQANNYNVSVTSDGTTNNTSSATVLASSVNGNVSSLISNVRVVTDGTSGYSLTLQSVSANMIGQTNNYILRPVINGTISNPTTFTPSNCNSWGFATPAVPNNPSQAFDTAYSIESSKEVGLSASKYAAVPTTATLIHESALQDETRPYYFAACVNTTLPADIYQATVVWTAYATDPPALPSDVVVDIDPCMIPVRWNYDSCTYGNGSGNVMDSAPTVNVSPTVAISSSCWVKADPTIYGTFTNEDWYNYTTDATTTRDSYGQPYYKNRKMANVVTFTDSSKLATYRNAPIGTPIPEADIAGYWTYIPRFSYRIERFNSVGRYENTPTSHPHAFDVVLTSAIDATPATKLANIDTSLDPTTNPQYLTPPAFTFNGQELNGIWFGKYETGSEYIYEGFSYPVVKPLVYSSGATISRFFDFGLQFGNSGITGTVQSFAGGNLHNFTNIANVKSHMSKNSEWGILIYYINSMYGVCSNMNCTSNRVAANYRLDGTWDDARRRVFEQVGSNNSSRNVLTGYGPDALDPASSGAARATDTPYNTQRGVLASTTHNVYGIYDTVGGKTEYTTGVYATGSGSAADVYTPVTAESGFTNLVSMLQNDAVNYSPYFDIYPNPPLTNNRDDIADGYYGSNSFSGTVTSNANWNIYARKLGLGQGLFEATSWEWVNIFSVTADYPWFVRGYSATYATGSTGGINSEGIYGMGTGFRAVLTILP